MFHWFATWKKTNENERKKNVFFAINYFLLSFFFLFVQGFGATAFSTDECKSLDPTRIVVFHQADVGEYLRDEDNLA
jgi:hypothetical protein